MIIIIIIIIIIIMYGDRTILPNFVPTVYCLGVCRCPAQ